MTRTIEEGIDCHKRWCVGRPPRGLGVFELKQVHRNAGGQLVTPLYIESAYWSGESLVYKSQFTGEEVVIVLTNRWRPKEVRKRKQVRNDAAIS